MNDESDDTQTIIDPEIHAELQELCDDLEAIVDRHARIMAKYGLDYTDNDAIVVADRELAAAQLGEEAVRHLKADDEGDV
jgi:hypothetical protein